MNLQQLREGKGVSVADAAIKLGTTVQGIYRIEQTGRTVTTTLMAYGDAIQATWEEVCAACKVTIQQQQTPLTISRRRAKEFQLKV